MTSEEAIFQSSLTTIIADGSILLSFIPYVLGAKDVTLVVDTPILLDKGKGMELSSSTMVKLCQLPHRCSKKITLSIKGYPSPCVTVDIKEIETFYWNNWHNRSVTSFDIYKIQEPP